MTRANTDRGKETERLVAKALRELGFPNAERVVRTGYRVAGRELPDLGDIDGTPGIAWQVKSLRPATRAEAGVAEWMLETEQQRAAAGATVGVLVVRRELFLPHRWWAFLAVADLFGLANGFAPGLLPSTVELEAQLMPARLELADACTLLRSFGFGEPLEAAA